MARWLFKEEPTTYSFADLQRDGTTTWNGISNALALKHLRAVKKGDAILYYHTGKEKAVVGEMKAVGNAKQDEADPKDVSVEVAPVGALARPVTLAEVKADKVLQGWDLARLPRLSIVPVTDEQWERVLTLAREEAASQ